MSTYPNSIVRGVAGPLSSPTSPIPRAKPVPRRTPGRPTPHHPRRPPAPGPRPAPKAPRVARPAALPAVRSLPIISRPSFPSLAGKLGVLGAFSIGWTIGEWAANHQWFDPTLTPQAQGGSSWYSYTSNGVPTRLARFIPAGSGWSEYAIGQPRYWSVPGGWNPIGRVVRTPGYPGKNNTPGPGSWVYVLNAQAVGGGPGDVGLPVPVGATDMGYFLGGWETGASNWRVDHIASWGRTLPYVAGDPVPAIVIEATFGSTKSYFPKGQISLRSNPSLQSPLVHPLEIPWQYGAFPDAMPIHFVPAATPQAPPLIRPRLDPWSPQAPDVGPRLDPNEHEVREPEIVPVPPELPLLLPELRFQPAYVPTHTVYQRGLPRVEVRPRQLPRRARRGEKEAKMRMNPLARFLWNSFSPITETIDLVEVMYECLPKKTKVAGFQARGKQPRPDEKALIVYQNINALDLSCAVTNFIKEQAEDMIYALGSGKLKEANQKDLRPIGYEAGGGLTGGGPFVGIS